MNYEAFVNVIGEVKAQRPNFTNLDMPIFVDVDGTLIDHSDVPKPHVIRFLKYAHAQGCRLHLWSQGGADYCEQIAMKLGIEHLFVAFLDKPVIVVDDLPMSAEWLWHCVHPFELNNFDVPGDKAPS